MIHIAILLGTELFGGFYPRAELNYTAHHFPYVWDNYTMTWDDSYPSRYHFNDVGNSFLVIFVVLSGENWNEIMFDNHRATFDYTYVNSTVPLPYAIVYFILLFIVGNLLLFNLFIAILLSNFDDDDDEDEEDEEDDDEDEED